MLQDIPWPYCKNIYRISNWCPFSILWGLLFLLTHLNDANFITSKRIYRKLFHADILKSPLVMVFDNTNVLWNQTHTVLLWRPVDVRCCLACCLWTNPSCYQQAVISARWDVCAGNRTSDVCVWKECPNPYGCYILFSIIRQRKTIYSSRSVVTAPW